MTDTLGRVINYTYDQNNRLIQVAESGGKSVELAYYGSGDTLGSESDLREVTIRQGTSTKKIGFTYFVATGNETLDHNIRTLIDAKGQTYVENIYDADDRVLSQKYGNHTGSYVYTLENIHIDDTPTTTGSGEIIGKYVKKNRATNRRGVMTEYTYDRMGNVISRTTSLPGGTESTTRYTYDSVGKMKEEILPKGNGTTYAYDALGNKTMIRKKADMSLPDDDSQDIITTLTYSGAKNSLSRMVDPRGKVTEFTTDNVGNITAIFEKTPTGSLLRTSSFVYDTAGNLLESTDPR